MRRKEIDQSLTQELPAFGSVHPVKGSRWLYLDFYYFGERIRMPTEWEDTEANRELATKALNNIGAKIRKRTFCFAEAFPGADLKLKEFFSELEGKNLNPLPEDVLFGEFGDKWMRKWLASAPDSSKRDDYAGIYRYRLRPFFEKTAFIRLTSSLIEEFASGLVWDEGKNKGKPLSIKRMKNIMIPLKRIWEAACDEYQWTLRDPFRTIGKKVNELEQKRAEDPQVIESQERLADTRQVFTFSEWQLLLGAMDPFYHPVTEFMLMTGMIKSEILALRKTDVESNQLKVRRKVNKRGKEVARLKNNYRSRDIPITRALRLRLELAMRASRSEHVFTMKDGSPFDYLHYYRQIWCKALQVAGLSHKVVYVTRHTLVAWAEIVGVHQSRLVSLMGHADKGMINRVYGKYRKGLIDERLRILAYLGEDFLTAEEQRMAGVGGAGAAMKAMIRNDEAPVLAVAFGQSFSQSQGLCADNYAK